MSDITQQITVFNCAKTVAFIKEVFGDNIATCIHIASTNSIHIRLTNGSSFSIQLDNDNQLIKVEVRRKYTSIAPDFKSELYLNNNVAYVIKYMIKLKIEELWQKVEVNRK